MILHSDEDIDNEIRRQGLSADEYIVIDDLRACDEGLLNFEKKIFVRNLTAFKVNCNTNSKVLFGYLREHDINIQKFLKKYQLRDEAFYQNYLEVWRIYASPLKPAATTTLPGLSNAMNC